MSLKPCLTRWTAVMALGVLSLAAIAPAANAGHGRGNGKKWRRSDYSAPTAPGYWAGNLPQRFGYKTRYEVREPSCGPRYGGGYSRVVVRERSSSAGPLLAGLVGGFILGTAVAHASTPVAVSASYYYYDPYCEDRFSSLDACYSHYASDGCDHPLIVEKIDARSGQCAGEYAWDEGSWHTYRGAVYGNGDDYGYRDNGDRYRDRCRGDDDDDD